MPTKKPRVQSILEETTYKKLKKLQEKELRTESQMVAYIIKNYIEQYENEHGEIRL